MKTKNVFDLDPERLATTDENGERIYLYPEEVKGFWKDRRRKVYWFLIGLYLILPWFHVNGKPALQIDIFNREFTLLGFTLHGFEPILFFLLATSGLFFIAFVTSLWGRVWCGWACPQTVFIQSIFWKVEAMIEGSAKQQRELNAAPWNIKKFWKRGLKWALFIIISLHIAHTFIGYFVGPRNLLFITTHSPFENWGLFTATMIVTAICLLDFGWFREQFCIIACPYGRMQSVMMDENSLVVSYDVKRGEPRLGLVEKGQEGDCINCFHCVKVCPTGIDIRRGTQLECIACTQCIDACDAIMEKLKRPHGLIRYASENEISGKESKKITFRSGVYVSVCLTLIASLAFFLSNSTQLKMDFLRSKTPYRLIDNGRVVLNNFNLKLSHQGTAVNRMEFRLKDESLRQVVGLIVPSHPMVLDTSQKKVIFLIRFPLSFLAQHDHKVVIEAVDQETGLVLSAKEVTLVGPNIKLPE